MSQLTESPAYQAWLERFIGYLEALKMQTHTQRLEAALDQLPPGATGWTEADLVSYVEVQAQLDPEMVRLGAALWSMMQVNTPLVDLLPRITCPILLMTGARSFGDQGVAQEVAAAWRSGRHVVFEQAGHLIHLDQFDRFIEVVKTFLSEVDDEG